MFDNASELAREVGVDPSTVRDWIYQGKIRGYRSEKKKKRKPGQWWRIPENQLKLVKKKPYEKYSRNYTDTEIAIIVNACEPIRVVAGMIRRTANAVKIKRCRLRKQGYRF